jgi:hypothetical protein
MAEGDTPAPGGTPVVPVVPAVPAATPAPAAPAAPAATLAGGADPAASATPASGAPPATLAGGAPGPDTRVVVTTTWPEDWRTQAAGGDAKLAKSLETIADPSVLAKSYAELRSKVSSGELKAPPKPPAADAKPEEIVAWRKEQALPETAEAYVKGLKLPDGLVPGENDSPLLASFADAAYKNNWTGEQYAQAIGWFYAEQDRLAAVQEQKDSDYNLQSNIEIKREWGTKDQENRNILANFWAKNLPQDFYGQIAQARMPDGTKVFDHPQFARTFLAVASITNPEGSVATLLPSGQAPTLGNVQGRMAEIAKLMNSPQGSEGYRTYWHGESGQKLQAEYRQLIEADQAMRGRQA